LKQTNLARLTFLGLALVAIIAAVTAACGGASEAEERAFDLTIEDRKLDLDPAVMEVKQKDSVTLRIDADEHGTFHLHGYDIEIEVGPDETATMDFVANATGGFPITFHPGAEGEHGEEDEEEEEIAIASLEVRPR
jgi:hypothetical protein